MQQIAILRTNRRSWVSITAMAGLLFLRFVIDGGTKWLVPERLDWVDPVFDIGTYLLCAVLIWHERDHLEDFHFGRLALVIILLFKPIQPLFLHALGVSSSLAFPNPLSFSFLLIAIGLSTALWRAGVTLPKITPSNWIWMLVGILCGVIINFMLAFWMAPLNTQPLKPFPIDWSMIWAFPYQVGYAAVSEEPLFRGFLWGYLSRIGWRDGWICIFQAGIFMLGHIFWINYPNALPALIVTFFMGMIFGLLVWRSRSLATSLVAHGFYNAASVWSMYFLARL